MKTATRKTEVSNSSIDASSVLLEQAEEQRRTLAQAGLYRSIVEKAARGEADESEVSAARILAQRWNWDYDADLGVLKELDRYSKIYPSGFVVAMKSTWDELVMQASRCRQHDEESKKVAYELELKRQELEKLNARCNQWSERPEVIKRAHPHLFEVAE